MTSTTIAEPPNPWGELYSQFHSENWIGWISRDYEQKLDITTNWNPLELFNVDNVHCWFKTKRNRLALVGMPDKSHPRSPNIVLKSYQGKSFFHTLRLKSGEPRALRHWNRVWQLNEKGIRTPQPVFVALPRTGGNTNGVIAVEFMEHFTRLGELIGSDTKDGPASTVDKNIFSQEEMVKAGALYLRALHNRGIVHRDFSGGNVLVPDAWNGELDNLCETFCLIDINRVRNVDNDSLNIRLRIQDLERLTVPDSLLEQYYLTYAGDDSALCAELPRFLKYRKAYRKIRETKNPVKRAFLKTFTYWPRTG